MKTILPEDLMKMMILTRFTRKIHFTLYSTNSFKFAESLQSLHKNTQDNITNLINNANTSLLEIKDEQIAELAKKGTQQAKAMLDLISKEVSADSTDIETTISFNIGFISVSLTKKQKD